MIHLQFKINQIGSCGSTWFHLPSTFKELKVQFGSPLSVIELGTTRNPLKEQWSPGTWVENPESEQVVINKGYRPLYLALNVTYFVCLFVSSFLPLLPFSPKVGLSSEADWIQKTSCACRAGRGHCSHLIGLLYTLAHFQKLGLKTVPKTKSKTALPQTWHIPSRQLGLKPKPSTHLHINKLKPIQTDRNTEKSAYGIGPKMYCPIPLPCFEEASVTFANSLLENLKAIGGQKCQMVDILDTNKDFLKYVPTDHGNLPHGSALTYQTLRPPVLAADEPSLPLPLPTQPCNYSTVLPKVLYVKQRVNI